MGAAVTSSSSMRRARMWITLSMFWSAPSISRNLGVGDQIPVRFVEIGIDDAFATPVSSSRDRKMKPCAVPGR